MRFIFCDSIWNQIFYLRNCNIKHTILGFQGTKSWFVSSLLTLWTKTCLTKRLVPIRLCMLLTIKTCSKAWKLPEDSLHEKWYLHITITTTTLTQDTLGWGPVCEPHPNVSCVSVVVVDKKCKYHFPSWYINRINIHMENDHFTLCTQQWYNTKAHWGGTQCVDPTPNVPWCCVIVVHCECFDNFPIHIRHLLDTSTHMEWGSYDGGSVWLWIPSHVSEGCVIDV